MQNCPDGVTGNEIEISGEDGYDEWKEEVAKEVRANNSGFDIGELDDKLMMELFNDGIDSGWVANLIIENNDA